MSLYTLACINTKNPLLKYIYGFVVKFTSYNLPAIYLHTHTDSKTGPPLHLRILSINPKTLQPPCPPSTSVLHFYFPKWAIAILHKTLELERKHLNHASGHMVRPAFEQCQTRDLLTPHAGSRRMCAAQHAATWLSAPPPKSTSSHERRRQSHQSTLGRYGPNHNNIGTYYIVKLELTT